MFLYAREQLLQDILDARFVFGETVPDARQNPAILQHLQRRSVVYVECPSQLDKKKIQYERQLSEVRTKKQQSEKEIQDLMGSIAKIRHQISLQSSKQISKLQGQLAWPAKGKRVVSFAPEGSPASNGIGISLSAGTPVRSISWGKVVHNDQLRGFGQVVIVFHGEDYYSLYAFLSDAPIPVGREVERGEQIGVCGFYPAAKGNGLYFELRYRQKVINPLKWLQSG